VQAGGGDQRPIVEQAHQRLITVRTVLNTSSNIAVVSRPVFVL